MSVATGLDRIVAGDEQALASIRGRRIGLVAHPASVDRRLRHAVDVLREVADLRVLFGPEHGFAGTAQDMAAVDGEAEHAMRVVSLYGSSAADLSPRPEHLEGLDVIVVDLQDVGSRYYTFVWTAALMARAAAAAGVRTVILDRPNPLGGELVEGMSQRTGYRSFVGLHDVAVRHGMTIGEIVRLARPHAGMLFGSGKIAELKARFAQEEVALCVQLNELGVGCVCGALQHEGE